VGFVNADLPDVDLATWKDRPHLERMKILALHWIDYGMGTPKMIHVLYVVKIAFFVLAGLLMASRTAGIGNIGEIADWWLQPIFYQKLVVWVILFEMLGLGRLVRPAGVPVQSRGWVDAPTGCARAPSGSHHGRVVTRSREAPPGPCSTCSSTRG